MEPNAAERRVIATAEDLAATLTGDPNHTVAAAALDVCGRIHRAVNAYHFTGGPCAELVALGVAAAHGGGPLLAIAAAGDGGRGLLAPCGRCRQVLVDEHPDVLVAIPSAGGAQMCEITDLLPHSYRHPDAAPQRVLRFNKRYADAVADGTKTETVRWRDRSAVGPALLVFEDHPDNPVFDARITGRTACTLADLDAGQRAALGQHYPQLPADAALTRVRFQVVGRLAPPR